MKESQIEKYLKDEVKKIGGRCVKLQTVGYPDQLVILNGFVFFVECKQAKGRHSDAQLLRIAQLKELNQNVVSVFSVSDVDALITQIKERLHEHQ